MSQFFFAWVDYVPTTAGGPPPFGPEHEVEDEKIFSAVVEQLEGEFAELRIEIQNPRVGLLAPGRPRWAWLGWDGGATSGGEGLFFGRLIGIPDDLFGEVITLEFAAKPADFIDQQTALAETLKVLPFYDPIFIDEQFRDDPNVALIGYSAYWDINRTTHVVTITDYISGEEGLEQFTADEVPYDSLEFHLENPPFTSVDVEMNVNWTQAHVGAIDIGAQNFVTYTGDGIISDWPKPGASLGGGWAVADSSAIDVYGVGTAQTASWSWTYHNNEKTHDNGDTLSQSESRTQPVLRGSSLSTLLTDRWQVGINDPFSEPPINRPAWRQSTSLHVAKWLVSTTLSITYESDRKRSEKLSFTLTSDLQAVLTDSDEEQRFDEPIKLNGADVAVPIPDDSTAGATAPIGDSLSGSYFPIDRGLESIKYGISVAAAKLIKASRAGELSWDISFERAVNLSCRKNASIEDDRIPGGSASGKIIAYSFEVNGDERRADGAVTIGSAIGFGNVITAAPGEDDYIDDDYIENYYERLGETILVSVAGSVGFSPPVAGPNDDGLVFPLTRDQAVISESVTGSLAAQEAAINDSFLSEIEIALLASTPAMTEQIAIANQQAIANASVNSTANALKNNPIFYTLELVNLTGKSFATNYDLELTKLTIPKQLDLESPAAT